MRLSFGLIAILAVSACTPPSSQSNHQNLNVAECQKLAKDTFEAGEINNNLCPGYMPDGQAVELF